MGEDRKRSGILRGIVACAAAAMLLAAIYVGSYLALSDPIRRSQGGDGIPTTFMGRRQSFSFGGEASELIFWPLTQLDKQVRPDYWVTPEARRIIEADRALEASSSN